MKGSVAAKARKRLRVDYAIQLKWVCDCLTPPNRYKLHNTGWCTLKDPVEVLLPLIRTIQIRFCFVTHIVILVKRLFWRRNKTLPMWQYRNWSSVNHSWPKPSILDLGMPVWQSLDCLCEDLLVNVLSLSIKRHYNSVELLLQRFFI